MSDEEKISKHFQVIPSDRIPLIFAANSFIYGIIHKETSAIPQEISPEEASTYNSALDFLSRQFKIGYREPEINQISLSVETKKKEKESAANNNEINFPM